MVNRCKMQLVWTVVVGRAFFLFRFGFLTLVVVLSLPKFVLDYCGILMVPKARIVGNRKK